VAAGGGMTLNVGPAADGKIPLLQQERLLDLGKWLEVNGEAIYGTRPYKKFYEMKPVTMARKEEEINFDWKRNSPDPAISCDHFQAHWVGEFFCEKDDYTFEIQTDDKAQLVIDGQTVIEDTKKSPTGKIKLAKGLHSIDVFYEEDELEATITLYWSSKQMEKQVMNGFQAGLKATYTCEQPNVCYTQSEDALYAIALDYPEDQLVLNIEKPEKDTKVTLLGCEKILPWTYKDGQLIIDTSGLKYSDLKSTAAWVFKME
jgi:hypothetical protein